MLVCDEWLNWGASHTPVHDIKRLSGQSWTGMERLYVELELQGLSMWIKFTSGCSIDYQHNCM